MLSNEFSSVPLPLHAAIPQADSKNSAFASSLFSSLKPYRIQSLWNFFYQILIQSILGARDGPVSRLVIAE